MRNTLLVAMMLMLGACGGPEQPPLVDTSTYQPTPEEQSLLDRLTELQSTQGYEQGLAEANAFLTDHPEARRIHYAIGVLQGLMDNHLEAFFTFERELERDPGHLASYRGAAIAALTLGDAESAIDRLEQASRLDPEHPKVLLELGRALSNVGRFDEAGLILERAVEHGGAAASVELGILQRRQGDLESASTAFQEALRQDPKELPAMVNLGQTLIALGRVAEGQALLRRHAEQATLADRIDVYRRSSLVRGATSVNFLHLGRLHVRSRNFVEAANAYRRALEFDSGSTEATIGLAALFLRAGQMEEATKWAVRTLLIDPENTRAYFLLGMVRLSKGEIAEALRAFETSEEHEPWGADKLRVAADALRSAEHYQLAASYYERAIVLDPTSAPSHHGLGLAKIWLEQQEAATENLRRAVELDPSDAQSQLLFALLLHRSGEVAAARRVFEDAAKLHRLEVLTGRRVDRLLAPFISIPGTRSGLAAYRSVLQSE